MRGSMKQRFGIFQLLYEQSKAKVDIKDTIENAVKEQGYVLSEKELEKFGEQYPHVDMADFKEFLSQWNAIKASKRRSTAGGERIGVESTQRAEALGLTGNEISMYCTLVGQIKELGVQVNALLGKRGQWQQAVKNPVKPKEEAVVAEEVPSSATS